MQIIDVISDEPDDGLGDGDTAGDVAFSTNAVCVRRERSALGDGRTYTVTIEASDRSGNTTRGKVRVSVPDGKRNGLRCTRTGVVIANDAPC